MRTHLGIMLYCTSLLLSKVHKLCYSISCLAEHAPIVYRLGHQVLILKSGVRLPVGAQEKVCFQYFLLITGTDETKNIVSHYCHYFRTTSVSTRADLMAAGRGRPGANGWADAISHSYFRN